MGFWIFGSRGAFFLSILLLVAGFQGPLVAQPLLGWESLSNTPILESLDIPELATAPEGMAEPFVPFTLTATASIPREGLLAVWNYGDASPWESFEVRPDYSARAVFGGEGMEPAAKTVLREHTFQTPGLFLPSVTFFSKDGFRPVRACRIPVRVRSTRLWTSESREPAIQGVDKEILSAGLVREWVATAADGRIFGLYRWNDAGQDPERIKSEKFRFLWAFDPASETLIPGQQVKITAEFVASGENHDVSQARARISFVSSRDGRMVPLLELVHDPDLFPKSRIATFSAPLTGADGEHFAVIVEAFCDPGYKAFFTYSWKLAPNTTP